MHDLTEPRASARRPPPARAALAPSRAASRPPPSPDHPLRLRPVHKEPRRAPALRAAVSWLPCRPPPAARCPAWMWTRRTCGLRAAVARAIGIAEQLVLPRAHQNSSREWRTSGPHLISPSYSQSNSTPTTLYVKTQQTFNKTRSSPHVERVSTSMLVVELF